MRAFFAFALPDTLRDILFFFGKSWGIANPEAKLTKKENLHLTLLFLGEITLGQASCLQKELLTLSLPSFMVRRVELSLFPPREQRLLWAKLFCDEQLFLYHRQAREICQKNEIPFDPKPFTPHITLARFKNKTNMENETYTGNWQIDKLGLYESTLTAGGPIYSIKSMFNLKED